MAKMPNNFRLGKRGSYKPPVVVKKTPSKVKQWKPTKKETSPANNYVAAGYVVSGYVGGV